ncbi:MAG: sugar phosphate isomerase/epimerase [Nitrospirae bacterium]|nr:sugar phosphate isomerase/epimerase [Nitrospirota bacterium]
MPLGYGVLSSGNIDSNLSGGIVQVSVFKEWGGTTQDVSRLIERCRDMGLRYVIHPVGYYLSETREHERAQTLDFLRRLAEMSPDAIIVHDEGAPWGARLEGIFERCYVRAVEELSTICRVSIENAHNTPDIRWFWGRYAASITLDIGHVEAAGINSIEFVNTLDNETIEKIDFVHIHKCNGKRSDGSNDHWGLDDQCRELHALRQLLKRKKSAGIIVEVVEHDQILNTLKLIEPLMMEEQCS